MAMDTESADLAANMDGLTRAIADAGAEMKCIERSLINQACSCAPTNDKTIW